MTSNSRLARDTQSLRWSVLTKEEKDVINDVNELILAVKKEHENKNVKENKGPWATPEMDRYNNVIMLNGPRGSGKTSLLLTLITGWQKHDRLSERQPDQEEAVKQAFQRMKGTVYCLKPLDFDPLPPDLPLYNWIIQAFEPLIKGIGGRDATLNEWTDEEAPLSLRDRFRKLQDTAALGWTTGLLKGALAKDVGDFIVWHSEQQSRWHNLARDWQLFLDTLFKGLEDADSENRIGAGAVIVLPIDDLDLQARRVRELLSVLRVLRHGRLVYLLTGESDNLLVNLRVEFFRDCVASVSCVTDALLDQVKEQSDQLAQGLFRKVVPEPNRFDFKGIPLSEILDWSPTGGKTIGTILDNLWLRSDPRFTTQLKPIFKYSSVGMIVPFRNLQGFHDRWQYRSNDLDGIVGFLEVLFPPIEGEGLVFQKDSERIEINGDSRRLAPAPREYTVINAPDGVRFNLVLTLDFAATEQVPPGVEPLTPVQALPEQRILLDLASEFPQHIIIFTGPRLAEQTLGFVWSAVPRDKDEEWLVPWPMVNRPSSPTKWHQGNEGWNQTLAKVRDGGHQMTPADLLEAWFRFNVPLCGTEWPPPNDSIKLPEVAEQLAPLAAGIYGLPDDQRRKILQQTGTQPENYAKLEAAAAQRVYSSRRSDHDPYHLAMRPSEPDARPKDEAIDAIAKAKPISNLIVAKT